MPGPVEVRIGNPHLTPGRRMPQLRELLGLGWRGADVKAYLASYRETLSALPKFNKPSDIFLPLTELFFARSSFEVKSEMAEKAKNFALGVLGADVALEEQITLQVIDRVIAKIEAQGQYRLRDVLLLISEEARRPLETIDQYFLERMNTLSLTPYLDALKSDMELRPEDRLILDILSKPEMLPHLETIVREVSKLEMKGPEKIKTIEKILLGLREMGLDEMALKNAPLETLRRAYLIGSLKEFAFKGALPLNDVTWMALLNVLTDPRLADARMLSQLVKLQDLRLFILGLTGLGMGAEAIFSFFLKPLDLPDFSPADINKLFDRVQANGLLTNRLLMSLEGDPSFIIEELSHYGAGHENSAIIENVCTKTDPVRTTANLMNSLNESSVELSNATSLIDNIIKTRETEEERDDVYYSLVTMLERTDIPMSDRRMTAVNLIFNWHPEAMGAVLERYLELYDTYSLSSFPIVGYLSSAKGAIDRLETFILTQIEISGNREMAKALLTALRAQASLAMSIKMSEALVRAMHYTGVDEITRFNLHYAELMANQLKTIPTASGQITVGKFLPRDLIMLTLNQMTIEDLIRKGNLQAAQEAAAAGASYANQSGVRAATIRYLSAFLQAAINGRLTDRSEEELRIAITTDKQNGLMPALHLVQGVLKNEVYTQLENIIRSLDPINLPTRLTILGDILRDQRLSDRDDRFALAKELLEKLEKDQVWIKLLDMVETQQYEKAQSAISAWIKDQLVSA